jgi:hypothetical protein
MWLSIGWRQIHKTLADFPKYEIEHAILLLEIRTFLDSAVFCLRSSSLMALGGEKEFKKTIDATERTKLPGQE